LLICITLEVGCSFSDLTSVSTDPTTVVAVLTKASVNSLELSFFGISF